MKTTMLRAIGIGTMFAIGAAFPLAAVIALVFRFPIPFAGYSDHAPEGTEQIQSVKLPLAEAVRMVMTSEITHGPSCVLVFKVMNSTGDNTSA